MSEHTEPKFGDGRHLPAVTERQIDLAAEALHLTAKATGLEPEEIIGHCRASDIVDARYVYSLALSALGLSYRQIAVITGRRNHTTPRWNIARAVHEILEGNIKIAEALRAVLRNMPATALSNPQFVAGAVYAGSVTNEHRRAADNTYRTRPRLGVADRETRTTQREAPSVPAADVG